MKHIIEKDYDHSWFADVLRVLAPYGDQPDGVVIKKEPAVHVFELSNALQTEHLRSLYSHWLSEDYNWLNYQDGVSHYKGPEDI